MSRPLRCRTAAVLILAGLSTSPAFSNPFDALFNRAPEEAAAPAPANDAPAKDECLSRPGKPTDGQHWMYHLDGHRKCWFLVPEEDAASRTRVHRHSTNRRLASSEEDATAPRKRKAVVDARAELMPPAPEEALQPTPAPTLRVVDAAASVPATGAAALVPSPPTLAAPDQLPPDQSNQRQNNVQDNVETLLAATPADSDTVAVSEPPSTSVATPIVTGEDGRWWTARWLGPLLMALGLISLLIATRPLRGAALVAQRLRAPKPEGLLDSLEPEGRLDSLPSEFESPAEYDSPASPRDRHHAQATRHGARQIAEHQLRSRSSVHANQDMTLQEAISVLTDFDATSVEARPGLPTPRRLDAAPGSGRTRTYAFRMN